MCNVKGIEDNILKKEPFIYKIGDDYFCMGLGVFNTCNPAQVNAFNDFEAAFDPRMTDVDQLSSIFYKLRFWVTPSPKDNEPYNDKVEEELADYISKLEPKSQEELLEQIERFANIYHRLYIAGKIK